MQGSSFYSFVAGWNLIAFGYLSELNSVIVEFVGFSISLRIIFYLIPFAKIIFTQGSSINMIPDNIFYINLIGKINRYWNRNGNLLIISPVVENAITGKCNNAKEVLKLNGFRFTTWLSL